MMRLPWKALVNTARVLILLMLVLGLCAGCLQPPQRTAPKHILVIVIDALRADHLGAYGYARPTSPFIDRLAKEGVVFEQAFSNSSFTCESVASLFMGRFPSRAPWSSGWYACPDPQVKGMAHWMKEFGYTTGLLSNTPMLEQPQFHKPFDVYDCLVKEFGISGASPKLSQRALDFMRKHRKEKSFLYLHYLDPHSPYTPPEAFYKRFSSTVYPKPVAMDDEVRPHLPALRETGFGPGEERFEDLLTRYDAEIALVDNSIKTLLDGLEQEGFLEETLIVLTADHGEEFLEHDFVEHAWRLYPESLQVPLIFWWPGRLKPAREREAVSLVDLLPTLLSLVGASETAGPFDGAPLFSWREGKGWRYTPHNKAIISELVVPMRNIVRSVIHEGRQYIAAPLWHDWEACSALVPRQRALRDALLSGVESPAPLWGAPQYEALFELDTDPGSRRNILSSSEDEAQALRKILDEYRQACPAPLPDTFKAKGQRGQLSIEQQEMLESLGYLGEASAQPSLDADREEEEKLRNLGYL